MYLKDLIQVINKKDGLNTIRFFGSEVNLPKLPTGVFTLDAVLRGGIPKASITEIIGQENTGKSTLCYQIIAQTQRFMSDRYCVYVDMEHAFNPKYASEAGVDLNNLVYVQPQSGSKVPEYVEDLTKTNENSLIVIDSITALVVQQQQEQLSIDKPNITPESETVKLLARFCRIIPSILNKTDTTLVIVNQWKNKSTRKVTFGGNSFKYTAKLRIDLNRDLNNSENNGLRVIAKVLKNNAGGSSFKEASYTILFDKGIDQLASLIEYAIETGILTCRGSIYYFFNQVVAKSKEAVVSEIKANNELFNKIAKIALTKIEEISLPTLEINTDFKF